MLVKHHGGDDVSIENVNVWELTCVFESGRAQARTPDRRSSAIFWFKRWAKTTVKGMHSSVSSVAYPNIKPCEESKSEIWELCWHWSLVNDKTILSHFMPPKPTISDNFKLLLNMQHSTMQSSVMGNLQVICYCPASFIRFPINIKLAQLCLIVSFFGFFWTMKILQVTKVIWSYTVGITLGCFTWKIQMLIKEVKSRECLNVTSHLREGSHRDKGGSLRLSFKKVWKCQERDVIFKYCPLEPP